MPTKPDPIQAAVEHAYANGCSLIELTIGNRTKLLLTTKNGHRLRGFELSEVDQIIKFIDQRRDRLAAQRRSLAPKPKE